MTKAEKNKYVRKYYQEHRDELIDKNRKYKQEHRDEIKTQRKKYYEEHKNEIIKNQIEYQKRNKKKRKEYMLKWRQEHRDKVVAYRIRWRQYDKDYGRTYRLKNKRIIKQYNRKAVAGLATSYLKSIIKAYYKNDNPSEYAILFERVRLAYNRILKENFSEKKTNELLIKSIHQLKQWRKKNEQAFRKAG